MAQIRSKQTKDLFDARIFIQGVANYVPYEENGKLKLQVLFPSQSAAGLEGFELRGKEICTHHAVVEMDARHLQSDPKNRKQEKKQWSSIPIDGREITVKTDAKGGMKLEPKNEARKTKAGFEIPGLPFLPRLLEDFGFREFPPLPPRASIHHKRLAGWLLLEQGTMSPDSRAEGEVVFRAGEGDREIRVTGTFSNLMKVELGAVTSLSLQLRSQTRKGDEVLQLYPVGDQVDVWIRHYCEVGEEPTFDQEAPCAGVIDVDFLLNYVLHDGLVEQAKDRLPIPEIPTSWIAGSPIGGNCVQCAGICDP